MNAGKQPRRSGSPKEQGSSRAVGSPGISQAQGQRGRSNGGPGCGTVFIVSRSPALSDLTLKTTPLTAAHRAAGARMVAFGGYEMPVQYARRGAEGAPVDARARRRPVRRLAHGPVFPAAERPRAAIPRPTTPPSAPCSSPWSAATSRGLKPRPAALHAAAQRATAASSMT